MCLTAQSSPYQVANLHRAFPRVARVLSTAQLEALLSGLIEGDERLAQRVTTLPSSVFLDAKCAKACAIGYCGMRGSGLVTVREVQAFFKAVSEALSSKEDGAALYSFMRAYDTLPRSEMFFEMASAASAEIVRREAKSS